MNKLYKLLSINNNISGDLSQDFLILNILKWKQRDIKNFDANYNPNFMRVNAKS